MFGLIILQILCSRLFRSFPKVLVIIAVLPDMCMIDTLQLFDCYVTFLLFHEDRLLIFHHKSDHLRVHRYCHLEKVSLKIWPPWKLYPTQMLV